MPLRQRLSRVLRPLVGAAPPPGPNRRLTPADVAIIVLNWNKRDVTLACLDSLAARRRWAAPRVLGGRQRLARRLGRGHPGAPLPTSASWRCPRTAATPAATTPASRAALEAGAGAVLLLNNDTEVAPDFLEPLLEVLNGNPRAAAVSSAVMRLDSPEVLQEAWCDVHYGFGLGRGTSA